MKSGLKIFWVVVLFTYGGVLVKFQIDNPTIPLISPMVLTAGGWLYWYLYPSNKLALIAIVASVPIFSIGHVVVVGSEHIPLLFAAVLCCLSLIILITTAEHDRRKNAP